MKIKLFTAFIESALEGHVNDWIAEQGQMIEVKSWHFSTAPNADDGVVVFSVMIVYRDL
jgi:hypothetical protein